MSYEFKFAKSEELSSAQLADLAQMINEIYTESEKGLFNPGLLNRTSASELQTMILQNELMILSIDGQIKGCAQVVIVESRILKFGMLTIDNSLRGQGYGKIMINAIEDYAKQQGYSLMQLELLTPKTWVQSHKEFLRQWYMRLGFFQDRALAFDKKEILATECDFYLYQKGL